MKNILNKVKRGFTLVELLVVIGIIGVLAAGVAVALDPVDKTRSANDAKAQQTISVMSSALKAYASTNDGAYPTAANFGLLVTALFNNGDLGTATITAPATGYTFTAESTAADAKVTVTQLSKKSIRDSAPLGAGTTAFFCHDAGTNNTTLVDTVAVGTNCP